MQDTKCGSLYKQNLSKVLVPISTLKYMIIALWVWKIALWVWKWIIPELNWARYWVQTRWRIAYMLTDCRMCLACPSTKLRPEEKNKVPVTLRLTEFTDNLLFHPFRQSRCELLYQTVIASLLFIWQHIFLSTSPYFWDLSCLWILILCSICLSDNL